MQKWREMNNFNVLKPLFTALHHEINDYFTRELPFHHGIIQMDKKIDIIESNTNSNAKLTILIRFHQITHQVA